MSYIAHASEYENPVIEAMEGPEAVYAPTWSQDMSDAANVAYTQLIAKAIEGSMARVNCEYPWVAMAFAEYLHQNYQVPADDCDFLVMMVTQIIMDIAYRIGYQKGKDGANKLIAEFDEYIDWDRYLADHPEFKKGDDNNVDGTEVQ